METPFIEVAVPGAILALSLVIIVFISRARLRTATRLLAIWANRQGLEIEEANHRIFGGSFFPRVSSGQVVLRVTVRGPDGSLRRGEVRLGGFWLGLRRRVMAIRWDDTPDEEFVDLEDGGSAGE